MRDLRRDDESPVRVQVGPPAGRPLRGAATWVVVVVVVLVGVAEVPK